MTKAWRITRADSADLGFATAACTYQAVTVEEFRAWAEMVVLSTPDEDLPPYMIDYMIGPSLEGAQHDQKWRGIAGFMPYDPLLDTRANAKALTGIGHQRGVVDDGGHTPWVSKDDALRALDHHPIVAERFSAVFSNLTLGTDL